MQNRRIWGISCFWDCIFPIWKGVMAPSIPAIFYASQVGMTLGLEATPSQTWGNRLPHPSWNLRKNSQFSIGRWAPIPCFSTQVFSHLVKSRTIGSCKAKPKGNFRIQRWKHLKNTCQETYPVGVVVPPSEQSWIALKASRSSGFGAIWLGGTSRLSPLSTSQGCSDGAKIFPEFLT